MNQKIILALIASSVVLNLVIAIADVHGQGQGKGQGQVQTNVTGTSSIEKEIQKQKQTGIYQKDPCLIFHDARLVILDLKCPAHMTSLSSYVGQGYEIKATVGFVMYLTKTK
jgi:hypothetical protein